MRIMSTIRIPDVSNTIRIHSFQATVVGPRWSFHNHHHHSFELLYCWDGQVIEWLDEQPILFSSGDWLLIPPGMRHRTHNHSSLTFTYLSLLFNSDDPDFLRELKAISSILVTREDAESTNLSVYLTTIDSLILSISGTESSPLLSVSDKLDMQAYILLVIKDLMNFLKKKLQVKGASQSSNLHEFDLVIQMEEQIRQRLCDPDLSVTGIARNMGMSRNHCSFLFGKVYGMSPQEFISSQRLLLAKEKLTQTDASIQSVAFELGFSSLSHFSRQFKRWTGMPPLFYRMNHQADFTQNP